ncbi:MAG TPA: nucleotidyl transferase AbiEii/AbiGii toxin family protein [Solirubrobacteraceae bacterium]
MPTSFDEQVRDAADAAESDLRGAATQDLGDWFRFEVGPRRSVGDESSAVRLPVAAYIGRQEWERFHIDLVGSDLRMIREPDDVPPIAKVDLPELRQKGYRAYPLVDHVADKIAATFELYGRSRAPSTRYRDLVDLVAIARGASLDAEQQLRSLRSEAERRSVTLPHIFDIPDRALWESGYRREVAESVLTNANTLNEALAIVRPFVNPLLQGTAGGRWEHEHGRWTSSTPDPATAEPIPSGFRAGDRLDRDELHRR